MSANPYLRGQYEPDELCEGCDSGNPGYPCRICGKLTCVDCDTYYMVVNVRTGDYITDPAEILRLDGSLDGLVAHQSCVDPRKRLD